MSDAARECEVLLDKALDTIKQWRAENADLTARLASAEAMVKRKDAFLTECAAERESLRAAVEQATNLAEADKMIERKNAALTRPCISCGYQPKIVTSAAGNNLPDPMI